MRALWKLISIILWGRAFARGSEPSAGARLGGQFSELQGGGFDEQADTE